MLGEYLAGDEIDDGMELGEMINGTSSLGFMDLLGFQYFPFSTNTVDTDSLSLVSKMDDHNEGSDNNSMVFVEDHNYQNPGFTDINYRHEQHQQTNPNYSNSSSGGELTSDTTYHHQRTTPLDHPPNASPKQEYEHPSRCTCCRLKLGKKGSSDEMKSLLRVQRKKKQKEKDLGNNSRVAFMTKSEVDHLEDGFRWRKYGQKAVKNSYFPRSYYRCTSATCNVKKRVERSMSDPTIVVTTYEGKHIHPTPILNIHHQYQLPSNHDGESNTICYISSSSNTLDHDHLQDVVPSVLKTE